MTAQLLPTEHFTTTIEVCGLKLFQILIDQWNVLVCLPGTQSSSLALPLCRLFLQKDMGDILNHDGVHLGRFQ